MTTTTSPILTIFATSQDYLTKWDTELRAEPDLNDPGIAAVDAAPLGVADESVLSLEPIMRPTGDIYHPRRLPEAQFGKNTDVNFVCTAYANKMTVLLYGPPGTGKTALFEAALPNLRTVVGTAETETADFLGSYVATGDPQKPFEWVDGPLLECMTHGWPMLIDEIALIDSRVLSLVYSVMDGRDEIQVTQCPDRGTVKAKDGFMVFGACNPHVPGAIMSDALLSRFKVHSEVMTDWSLAKKLGVTTKVISAAKHLEQKWRKGEVMAPPQLREVLTFRDVAATFGEKVAISNFISQARESDRDHYKDAMVNLWGADVVGPLTFN